MNFEAAVPISQGTYTYLLNGAEAGVTESWAVFPQPDGGRLIRAARSAPAFASSIEVDATERASQIMEFEVRWRNSSPGSVPEAEAHYKITPAQIKACSPSFTVTLPALPGLVVSPLLRIFQGPVIKRVAELGRGERVPVLVPWILDPKDGERLLTPLIDQRSASCVAPASVEINGQRIAAERYSYLGGHYDDSAEFYLDEDALLLRYSFRESDAKVWDVQLSTFERATERIPNG